MFSAVIFLKELTFSIKPRLFNISIDSFFLNNLSSLFLHLLQLTEITNDVLSFSDALYLPQIMQNNFFHLFRY